MSYNFDSYLLQAKFDGANWETINADVITDISFGYGINGNGVADRVADAGGLTFGLNNTSSNSAGLSGYYSPGHVNCREGFSVGLQMRLMIQFDSTWKQKFFGRISADGIKVGTGIYAKNVTSVMVKDWMEQAAIHELSGLTFSTDKTLADTVPLIIANMPIIPNGSVTYYGCESTFPYVFDTTRIRTTAMSEFAKLALSEMGYIYMTRNGLVCEGRFTRTDSTNIVNDIPAHTDDCDTLELASGDWLQLAETSTGSEEPLLLDDTYIAEYDNSQRLMDVTYGKHIHNRVTYTAYPRKVDVSATSILFNLESPIQLDAGVTAVVKGRYSDPNNKATRVSGINMVTPAAGSHYAMYENDDGTGANLTAYMTCTAVFGTGDFEYTISNTGTTNGYVTLLSAVGKGVYIYDPIDYLVEDTAMQAIQGTQAITVEMKYQSDPVIAAGFANITLSQYSNPSYSIEKATFIANRSNKLLASMIYIEPGNKVRIIEDVSGVESEYFVQAVEYNISVGGVITFSWLLKDGVLDSFGFWELGVSGKSEIGVTTILDK